jgi:DNA-directed RNA polymerase specialized sigma24 family protein
MAPVLTESTITLLQRIRSGDPDAREQLMRRYLPRLRRWAHGRLPVYAREIDDTDDLVQNTLLRSSRRSGGSAIDCRQWIYCDGDGGALALLSSASR